MKALTPARLDVLRQCARLGGLKPLGPDWYAVYWLEAERLVARFDHGDGRRYTSTVAGDKAIRDAGIGGDAP